MNVRILGGSTNCKLTENNVKAISRESPASVIHLEQYDDDHSLRRGSSQITVVDPYHPSLKNSNIDGYPSSSSRRASLDPYRPVSPSRRASSDAYQSLINDKQFVGTPPRKPSDVDTYQTLPQRHASIRHASPKPQESLDLVSPPVDDLVNEKKNVSFEEEQQHPPRPQITAQQRWLWAYNKIIMQLNVSKNIILLNIIN